MEYRYIRTAREFLDEADRWNELVDNGVTPHTYLRHEWFRAWWNAFGGDKKLGIIVASEGGRWMGVAPLCVAPTAVGPLNLPSIRFASSDIGPRCEFILRENAPTLVDVLLEGMLGLSKRCWLCCLEPVSEESPTFQLLPAALRKQGVTFDMPECRTSPTLLLEGSWDAYLSALSKSFRQSIRRAWRRTERLGRSVSFIRMTDHDEIMAYLPKLFKLSARSWKKSTHTDMGATEAQRTFYQELSDRLSRNGRLIVWSIEADSQPVAIKYSLLEGKKVLGMRFDFDDNYRKTAPGKALLGYVLRDCFESGMVEHDFGGVGYTYKLQLANHIRKLHAFEIYPPRLFPRLFCGARRLLRRLRGTHSAVQRRARGALPEE